MEPAQLPPFTSSLPIFHVCWAALVSLLESSPPSLSSDHDHSFLKAPLCFHVPPMTKVKFLPGTVGFSLCLSFQPWGSLPGHTDKMNSIIVYLHTFFFSHWTSSKK